MKDESGSEQAADVGDRSQWPGHSDRHTVTVHGHELSYRTGGDGPVVLLVHGMAGSSSMWKPSIPLLEPHVRYLAPDLPGHGHSAKPRGDYSLGAQASVLRDLLATLGHDRVTLVGQSLGGGIAMQFAYQYPERCERLVLVNSGGLGEEVSPLLRGLALPGVDWLAPLAFQPIYATAVDTVVGWLRRVGLQPSPSALEQWRSYCSLIDGDTREAFLATLRAVVDHRGQRVNASDRLHLAAALPTLIVWGDEDVIIPVEHAHDAHAAIPGSRLEIFDGAGHFPHCDDPVGFTRVLLDFISTTDPAQLTREEWEMQLSG